MASSRRQTGVTFILIGLPLLSNIASFILFAPLFSPGSAPTGADYQRAGNQVGMAIMFLELAAIALIFFFLRREGTPLKSLFSFQRGKLRLYLTTGLIALIPTLAAGWLYVRAMSSAGVQTDPAQYGLWETVLWYGVSPFAAALLEETIWRGYALPRLRGMWRGLLLSSLSFSLFHGIFSPLVLVATFVQGMIWGWARRRAESTTPGMVLHVLSRFLVLIPGF
jgi:membrane protease YdiL (CAAX protease family)